MELEKELWGLLLLSTALKDVTQERVETDLAQRRALRKSNGVTGMAIYSQGNIITLTEGTKENVDRQYEYIKKYSGHHTIIKLYYGNIPYRFFEEEPLAFKVMGMDRYKYLDSFQSEEKREYFEEFLRIDHPISKIMREFLKNNA